MGVSSLEDGIGNLESWALFLPGREFSWLRGGWSQDSRVLLPDLGWQHGLMAGAGD